MHTPLLIGIYTFFAVATMCVSYFFLQAWLAHRRDREYLVFGALCATLAAHSASAALIYARGISMVSWSTLEGIFTYAPIPSKLAMAFAFHFTLLHTSVRRARAIAAPMYALMGAFVVLTLGGGWWDEVRPLSTVAFAGLSLHTFDVVPTAAARPYYIAAPLTLFAIVFLLGRHYLRSRQGLGAFVGASVLGLTVVNDLGVTLGVWPSFPMFAAGFLAFTLGVALTLVSRDAVMASALEIQTRALRERSRELERSYAELRRTQQELVRSEQLAVIGELAAVIAHEVRNPLAIVGNAVASLRKRHTTRGDRRTLLEIINEEMGRLDKLVGRLINYARPVVLDRTDVRLDEVVERASKVLDRSEVVVTLERRDAALVVVADPELLRQVFENVLSNAALASDAGSTIHVRFARRTVDGVPVAAVEIEDHGEGMTQEQLEHAHTPFFTTRPTGTGLGLPIVARIMSAHGGQLQLDSERGRGTTVTLLLPITPDNPLPTVDDDKRPSLLP